MSEKRGSHQVSGGPDLAEYALLISLIALVVIAGMTLLGDRLKSILGYIASSF